MDKCKAEFYLDIEYYAKQTSRETLSILSNSQTSNLIMEFKLTKDDWLPPSASSGEHNFDNASVKNG